MSLAMLQQGLVAMKHNTDLYKELKYFNHAWLSPLEVLKSATSHPVAMFKLTEIEYIIPDYKADMILLAASTIESITNTGQMETICKEGVAIDRY